ncbi:hypothetical protein IFM89_036214 [Coptis chinensis]|uniref:Formiminotransferase N-terminal subdomain domain-containing protein n=1 Tax=Coptis chinensis TaxID=261450 RepID=A0A835H165_9MAGN|nr:hypothetical protein IFM89_036214 [Coptis chinensis]
MVKAALETIDLESHCGTHPRLGIVDHICFHPLAQTSLDQTAWLARSVAADTGYNLEEEAEMVAAEVALELAKNYGWKAVNVEGDCSEVVKALNGLTCFWQSESLRDYVIKLSSEFDFCLVHVLLAAEPLKRPKILAEARVHFVSRGVAMDYWIKPTYPSPKTLKPNKIQAKCESGFGSVRPEPHLLYPSVPSPSLVTASAPSLTFRIEKLKQNRVQILLVASKQLC